VPNTKPASGRRVIQAIGALVRERADLKPAGVGKLAASRVYLGRLDLSSKVEGAVAAEAISRGPPPILLARG
jgi:hypothetical protein